MKRINLWIFSVIALLAISGCGEGETLFQADTFSDKDMCIVSIPNNKSLCYGDSRKEIEAILQETGDSGHPFVMYPSGVRISYRGDVAVGFQLLEGSERVYQTARGAHVGMSKAEVMNLYGLQYAYELTPNNLDYAYDRKTGMFVEKTQVYSPAVQQKREQIFLVSAMFDGNQGGAATQIGLIDQKMAVFLE